MQTRFMILSTLLVNVLIACGDPKPVSTGTKAPGLKPITGTTTTTTPAATGDATKGSTLVTSSCNTCHGTIAHKLSKSDSGLMTVAAGDTKNHASVTTVFTTGTNQADISAYLATQ